MINFVSTIRIIMTWTCEITLKCTLKFKILQLIQCIVETDNNDICVRDVEIQMQKVHFRIAVVNKLYVLRSGVWTWWRKYVKCIRIWCWKRGWSIFCFSQKCIGMWQELSLCLSLYLSLLREFILPNASDSGLYFYWSDV